MAELAITTFLSLDGVMQAPGGPEEDESGNFTYGGWLVPHFDEDVGKTMIEIFSRADAFSSGATHTIFLPHTGRESPTRAIRLRANSTRYRSS